VNKLGYVVAWAPFSEAFTKGKKNINIKFQAKPVNNSTGQIYDVRLIKIQQ